LDPQPEEALPALNLLGEIHIELGAIDQQDNTSSKLQPLTKMVQSAKTLVEEQKSFYGWRN